MDKSRQIIHPGWLRAWHWINVIAVLVMLTSGWRIYNATIFLGFAIPKGLTLGGWLGGALLWHFAAMWVLVVNGLIYLVANTLTRRFATRFWPLSLRGLVADMLAALKGHLTHADPLVYNMVQRFAYLFVTFDGVLLVLSGLVLWKSVQFPVLREILGGYEGARVVHYFAMAALLLFVVVHLVMVLLVPRTVVHMVRGY
jgi:thiosulfate reductase cytochrome b subunit